MPKSKVRCHVEECRLSLNLLAQTIGKCLCGSVYCPAHRQPEDHACTYDYIALGKKHSAELNPVITTRKLHVV